MRRRMRMAPGRFLGWSPQEIKQAFRDIDADSDGRLTRQEFDNFKSALEGVDRKVHGVGHLV